MKRTSLYIDLECVETGHGVQALLGGLAAERKNHKEIIKLVRKLAERDLEAVCSHQPIMITKEHGCFRVQDASGRNLFGRARKHHSSTHHNHSRGNR